MLGKVFAGGVDYDRVRVFERRWLPLQPGGVVMSPDGNIYYPPRSIAYSDDFSRGSQFAALFMHEMAHVYQHQQGVKVVARRLAEGGVYKYLIEPGKDLNDYTVEQQADIIKDYFRCLRSEDLLGLPPSCEFSPALDNFLKDPGYLREAERKRLEALEASRPPPYAGY